MLLNPIDLALSLLKDAGMAYRESRPDDWPPNYNEAYDEDDFSVEEREHQRLNKPVTPTPEPEPEELFDGFHDEHEFWGAHARQRMAGERTEDNEKQQIRDRINAALSQHLDKRGMFKMKSPKSFGIRTHILDEYRDADGSQGDSLWGMIYPKTREFGWHGEQKKNEPYLRTVMLRNSELSANPQSRKGKDFNPPVEKVIHAHGIPKRVMKERQRERDKRYGRDRRYKRKAEPMELVLQLLKTSVRGTGQDAYDNIYHYPNELNYAAMGDYLQQKPDSTLGDLVSPYLQGQFTNNPTNVTSGPPSYQSDRPTQFQSTVAAPFPQTPEQVQGVEGLMEGGFQDYTARGNNPQKPHYDSMMNAVRVLSGRLRGNPAFDFKPRGFRPGRAAKKDSRGRTRNLQNVKMQSMLDTPVNPIMAEMTAAPKQAIPISTGEPMEIAFQLLKERKSPAALAHKLEYDKQYQKNPKRVKYREQLNAERRKRGIYGKGGKDVSHTQGGKLTLESPHANRARHFKNRGTLRRVKVR